MDKKPAAVMRSGAQWDQILADYQESGQSIRTFCKAHGIGLSSFYAHKNRASGKMPVPRTPKAFVPVTVTAAPAAGMRLVIGSATVHLPATVSPAWVAELLRSLGG